MTWICSRVNYSYSNAFTFITLVPCILNVAFNMIRCIYRLILTFIITFISIIITYRLIWCILISLIISSSPCVGCFTCFCCALTPISFQHKVTKNRFVYLTNLQLKRRSFEIFDYLSLKNLNPDVLIGIWIFYNKFFFIFAIFLVKTQHKSYYSKLLHHLFSF